MAAGAFSEAILRNGRAAKAHLIDPWIFQDREDYLVDPTNGNQDIHTARYDLVAKRFASEVAAGQVVIHRDFSENILPHFPDGYFDWIYVDGMHTKDAVLRDLRLAWAKIKRDGFVLGHDYTNSQIADEQGFGVVEAVNEFAAETGALFLAMTMEPSPSYVLAKPESAGIKPFVEALLKKAGAAVELRGVPKTYRHKLFRFDNKLVSVPSF
ncbi:class I SAM-dependent methyltransferase [Nisaea sediminum]|uniref:class I SAM-dependent methyltransferase n=1 Tax=Nisaea sediminum TaxID=2775867 RepID=UPI0029C04E9E|nr:class I SAM-dependent methyltransferase [Nisaea sediminum]